MPRSARLNSAVKSWLEAKNPDAGTGCLLGVEVAELNGRRGTRLLARVEVVVAALAILGGIYFLVNALRDHSWSALWWLFLMGFAAFGIRDRVRSRSPGKR